MRLIDIAYYSVIRNFRDKKTLMMMILFPIVLIFILGTALGGTFTVNQIGVIGICILNDDSGILSESFISYFDNTFVKEMIKIIFVASYDEGIEYVKKGEATALIHIQKDFTEKAMNNDKVSIDVYKSQYSNFRISIVKTIIDNFMNGANTNAAIMKINQGIPMEYQENSYINIDEMPITAEGNTPRAIDYYAVTMLVMTMMYGSLYGNMAMAGDRIKNTYIRLNSAPIKSYELVLGNILGTIVTVFLQAVILIAFTKIVYKVNWGNNILFILFVCFSIIILSVSLGIMAYSLIKNVYASSGLLSIITSILTFISGGYVPLEVLSESTERLALLSPNYLAQQSIFNYIFAGPAAETRSFIMTIWIISAFMLLISSVAGRRAPKW